MSGPRDEGCFLCSALASDDDAKNFILVRRTAAAAVLNKYPYNTGHVMVAPVRHVGEIEDLSDEEHLGVMRLVVAAVGALRAELGPQGFNLGSNLGEVAGAGLPGHFHVHVVPRWAGDTNFMPVVAGAKVLPETLAETYARLRKGFEDRA